MNRRDLEASIEDGGRRRRVRGQGAGRHRPRLGVWRRWQATPASRAARASTRPCRGSRKPTFETVLKVVGALGLQLRAEASSAAPRQLNLSHSRQPSWDVVRKSSIVLGLVGAYIGGQVCTRSAHDARGAAMRIGLVVTARSPPPFSSTSAQRRLGALSSTRNRARAAPGTGNASPVPSCGSSRAAHQLRRANSV